MIKILMIAIYVLSGVLNYILCKRQHLKDNDFTVSDRLCLTIFSLSGFVGLIFHLVEIGVDKFRDYCWVHGDEILEKKKE